MKTLSSFASLLSAGTLLLLASVAHAETVPVSFMMPDGGVSSGLYFGNVLLEVVGTGQSLGPTFNDAFYLYADGAGNPIAPVVDGSFYQLTFGTVPLVAVTPSQNAANFIVGSVPAYDPAHNYSFVLNTGLVAPGALHFGVGDGNFGDNSGAYRVTITQLQAVPEPGSIALVVGSGFAGVALLRRRRR